MINANGRIKPKARSNAKEELHDETMLKEDRRCVQCIAKVLPRAQTKIELHLTEKITLGTWPAD